MKIHDASLIRLSMETSDGKIDQGENKDDGTRDGLLQQPEIENDEHCDKNKLNDKGSGPDGPVPCFCSKRWQFAYLAFFAMFWLYVHRVNLSMAIVCMVKPEDQLDDVLNAVVDNTIFNSNTIKLNDSDLYSNAQIGTVVLSKLKNVSTSNESSQIIQKDSVEEENHQERCQTAFEAIAGEYKGAVMPSVVTMISHWAPPQDRGKLNSFIMTGFLIGTLVTMSSSGLLCAYGFDDGWGSIFYIHGTGPLLFLPFWCYLVSSTPDEHRGITLAEKTYILQNRKTARKINITPWKGIFKSKPFYAVLIAHFCYNWTFYSIITLLPTYMKEVLKFDVKQNGLFSSLPFISMTLSFNTAGHLADFMVTKKCFGITAVRRILQTISFLGSGACFLLIGIVSCDTRPFAVALLSLCTIFEGLSLGGFGVNHMDFAGVFTGTVYGICNCIANTTGIIAPMVAGMMTKNGTQEEWRNFFYLTAGLNIFGTVVFATFARATLARWAVVETPINVEDQCETLT